MSYKTVIIRLFKHVAKLKFNKPQYLVLVAFMALALISGGTFFMPTATKLKPIEQLPKHQVTTKPKPKSVAPKQPAPPPTPATQPTPTPVAEPTPAPVTQPAPTAVATPAPVVTPAPGGSVPTLQPSTSSTSTTSTSTSSGSGGGTSSSSGSGSGSSTSSTPTATSTAYQSTNWSGYFSANSGETYTSVSGAWTADSPAGNGSSTSYDASWIGIGGVTSTDLIQVGTDNTVSAAGQVTSEAFYEMLPAPSETIVGFKVSPGDSLTASITETSANAWTITLTDVTQSETFTKNVSYTSTLSSAEWIEEAPSDLNGNVLPLDEFGTVSFTNAKMTDNGTSEDLAQVNTGNITMVTGSGTPEAVPSAIGADGASFSVQRK